MLPNVTIQKTDGNLGVATATDRILAIIGTSTSGDFDVAQGMSNKADILAEYGNGPLVEAATHMLAAGVPVVLVRSEPTTPGDYGTITENVTGTTEVTEGASLPIGDFDVRVEVLNGGTVGVAGIVYRYSLDGGVNWSAPQALGTSLNLACDSGVSFALESTETLITGDSWSVRTTAPKLLTADLATSLDALKAYSGEWLRVLPLADCDATILGQLNVWAKSFHADGKYPEVIAPLRARGAAESRATYQTALAGIVGAVQSLEVSATADHVEVISQVSGRRLRMPLAIPYAARLMTIDDSQDASAKADGALPGVFLTTAAGARDYHDERLYPGLDALGITTARTWGSKPASPGAYITNPRLLSGAGSDYRFFQHTAIVNRAIESAHAMLEPRLSAAVLVDRNTGRIREDVAASLEAAVSSELRSIFQDPSRVSGIQLRLSRTDNLLTTDTLSFAVDVQPLGYVKHFQGKAGLVRVLPQAA